MSRKRSNKQKKKQQQEGGDWTISKLFSTLKLRFWTMARDAATPLLSLNPFRKDHAVVVGSYEIIMESKTTFAKAEIEEFVTTADSTAQTLVSERKPFEGNVADLEALAALRKSRITIKEPTGMNYYVNVKKDKRRMRK